MSPRKTTFPKKKSEAFLNWLHHWYSELPVISFQSLLKDYQPDQTAIVSVDVVNGFCKEGNLSSPRVAKIIAPIIQLFKKAEQLGIHHYILLQDTHQATSKEFDIYPRHCVEGTEESRTISELVDLPHFKEFTVIPKRTINPGIEKGFPDWLSQHTQIRQFIVVGDCTDICVYLLAVYLKTYSVERDMFMNVVVPADCVDTYDIPAEVISSGGPLPHPGDLLHYLFLYHLQLNGIHVVAEIA